MMMIRTIVLLVGVGVASGAVGFARADDELGRANFPPPRHFDHQHLVIDLDIPDMRDRELSGRATLTATAVGRARDRLVLNADGLGVRAVSVQIPAGAAGGSASFQQEENRLTIQLPRAVERGESVRVVVEYGRRFDKPTGFGLVWTLGDESAESPTNQVPQIHTQGQPENNQSWFPCHDFPNERLSTEMIVTVEDGFVVGSNGRLVSTRLGTPGAGGRARTRWHWKQARPHPAYLVTLTIGKFAVVGLEPEPGVPAPRNADGEPIKMYLLTPIGTEESAAAVYRNTPRMMRFFAEYFDEPYPWEKYAQVIVRDFAFGGMENTSASTMNEGTATARPGSQDDLIAHELIHQWTGNLITCRSWEHAWLNEGWASFGEALWREHRAGPDPDRMRRAYQQRIAGFVGQQRGLNRTYAPIFPALVSNRYNQPLDVFMKPNDIYSKGAVVLHMLRMKLGDEVFLRGVRLYVDRYRFAEVETDNFRRVMEKVSGRSLDRFFTQWCTRPGLPRLAAELEWMPAGPLPDGPGTLTIRVEQTQRIDAFNPAFAFDLPVEARLPDGERRTLTLAIDSRRHEVTFDLPGKPRDVVFDPRLTVIAPTSIRKPLAMWLEQIRDDTSLFAQLQAAEHLSHDQDPAAESALAWAVVDPNSCDVLRSAASAGLAHWHRGRIADLWDRARVAGTRAVRVLAGAR